MAATYGPVSADQRAKAGGASISYSNFSIAGLGGWGVLVIVALVALLVLWLARG